MWHPRLNSGRKEEGTYARMADERRLARTRTVFYFFALVVVIGWLYVFLQSDFFLVSDVEVQGTKQLDPMAVKREVYDVLDHRASWRPWSARHAWFVDKEALTRDLKDHFFVVNVVVDKYFNVLRLKVEERSNKFIFHSHQQYFWVDLQGTATAELTYPERQSAQGRVLGSLAASMDDAPIIRRDLEEPLAAGYRVASQSDARLWTAAAHELASQDLLYRELVPPDASNTTMTLVSVEGYRIFMDIHAPLLPQIKTYEAFKRARTKTKVSEYVDVRIPGRVYVK